MYNQYQHPDITAALIYGYPRKPQKSPVCPICDWECESYFIDINGDVVACDVCWNGEIHFESVVDALEWEGV